MATAALHGMYAPVDESAVPVASKLSEQQVAAFNKSKEDGLKRIRERISKNG